VNKIETKNQETFDEIQKSLETGLEDDHKRDKGRVIHKLEHDNEKVIG
jgi:2-hydroxy-3-keto-5-methylthiopentenyl-1-phosphate phosphatase